MKKTLTTLITLLLLTNGFSQTYKEYELRRLNSFGIHLDSVEINNAAKPLNISAILEKEKKRRTNKTSAIVLTSLSVLTTTYGALLFSASKNEQEGLGKSISLMVMTVGVIELGTSIPLFISSNKRKKERDKLIELYKE